MKTLARLIAHCSINDNDSCLTNLMECLDMDASLVYDGMTIKHVVVEITNYHYHYGDSCKSPDPSPSNLAITHNSSVEAEKFASQTGLTTIKIKALSILHNERNSPQSYHGPKKRHHDETPLSLLNCTDDDIIMHIVKQQRQSFTFLIGRR